MAYDGTIPTAGQLISVSQPLIQGNFAAIDSSSTGFAVDHVTLTDGTNGGKHKKMTMVQQSGAQTTGASEVALYTKSLTTVGVPQPELYLRQQSNGTEVLMTRGTPVASSGEGTTYGGMQIRCGVTSYTGGGGAQAFTYAGFGQAPFATNTVSVVCSPLNSNTVVQTAAASYTSSGFSVIAISNCTFSFIAIGY